MPPTARPRTPAVLAVAAALATAAACSSGAAPAPAPAPPPPPPPPAACLLDTAALDTTTGIRWAPDASTASDTRCVYDPVGAPRPDGGPVFLAVDVTAAPEPAAALATVAELCEDGSRAPAGADAETGDTTDASGFVCRFGGGSVYAAVAQDDRVVTVSASAVPDGTTAARLVVAFDQQIAALSP